MIHVVHEICKKASIAGRKQWSWKGKISVGAATTVLVRGSSVLLSYVALFRLLNSSDWFW